MTTNNSKTENRSGAVVPVKPAVVAVAEPVVEVAVVEHAVEPVVEVAVIEPAVSPVADAAVVEVAAETPAEVAEPDEMATIDAIWKIKTATTEDVVTRPTQTLNATLVPSDR